MATSTEFADSIIEAVDKIKGLIKKYPSLDQPNEMIAVNFSLQTIDHEVWSLVDEITDNLEYYYLEREIR